MVRIPRELSGAFDWHPGLCRLIELSRAINHQKPPGYCDHSAIALGRMGDRRADTGALVRMGFSCPLASANHRCLSCLTFFLRVRMYSLSTSV